MEQKYTLKDMLDQLSKHFTEQGFDPQQFTTHLGDIRLPLYCVKRDSDGNIEEEVAVDVITEKTISINSYLPDWIVDHAKIENACSVIFYQYYFPRAKVFWAYADDLAAFALNLPIEYKALNKQLTKRILREAFKPELEQLGLDWVLTRLKEGMPAAVSGLAPLITERMEAAIDDSALSQHPLKAYLRCKSDVYLFNIFAETFQLGAEYALQDCSIR